MENIGKPMALCSTLSGFQDASQLLSIGFPNNTKITR